MGKKAGVGVLYTRQQKLLAFSWAFSWALSRDDAEKEVIGEKGEDDERMEKGRRGRDTGEKRQGEGRGKKICGQTSMFSKAQKRGSKKKMEHR